MMDEGDQNLVEKTREFALRIVRMLKLDETSYWLELLVRGEVVSDTKLASLRDEDQQLLAIFTTISK
ncbi:hypothetical protein BH23VER1_BH23VER1_13250 [soil metagenome]